MRSRSDDAPRFAAGSSLSPNDEKWLRHLVLFHYIYAVLLGLGVIFFLLYILLGLAIVAGPGAGGRDHLGGWFFIAFGSVFLVLTAARVVLVGFAGRCLAHRRQRTFCLLTAGFSCLGPVGMVLGGLTFAVLIRPEVRAEFDRNLARASHPGE